MEMKMFVKVKTFDPEKPHVFIDFEKGIVLSARSGGGCWIERELPRTCNESPDDLAGLIDNKVYRELE